MSIEICSTFWTELSLSVNISKQIILHEKKRRVLCSVMFILTGTVSETCGFFLWYTESYPSCLPAYCYFFCNRLIDLWTTFWISYVKIHWESDLSYYLNSIHFNSNMVCLDKSQYIDSSDSFCAFCTFWWSEKAFSFPWYHNILASFFSFFFSFSGMVIPQIICIVLEIVSLRFDLFPPFCFGITSLLLDPFLIEHSKIR